MRWRATFGAYGVALALLVACDEGRSSPFRSSTLSSSDAAVPGSGSGFIPSVTSEGNDPLYDPDADQRCRGEPIDSALSLTVVQGPEAGVPADLASICAADAAVVESNAAARVVVGWTGPRWDVADGIEGTIALEPSLAAALASKVKVAGLDEHAPASISGPTLEDGGLVFRARWGSIPADGGYAVRPWHHDTPLLRTTFDVTCATGTKSVEVITRFELCGDNISNAWIANGAWCCELPERTAPP